MSTNHGSQDDTRGGGLCLARCGDRWLLWGWEDCCWKEWLIFLPAYTDWTLEEEIRERIANENKAFYANETLFKSNLVSRKPKLKLYWSVTRPIVVYGCETWVLKESIIQKLSVFERKIFRKIFGPTKEANGISRIKTNKELDKLIKHRNIINYVKTQRLSWFGHINRIPETSTVKRIHKRKTYTRRPKSR